MTDFKQALRAHQISIDCPQCGRKLEKTLGWFYDNPNPVCACGVTFNADKLRQGLTDAEEAFDKAIKAMSQTLNVTFKL